MKRKKNLGSNPTALKLVKKSNGTRSKAPIIYVAMCTRQVNNKILFVAKSKRVEYTEHSSKKTKKEDTSIRR